MRSNTEFNPSAIIKKSRFDQMIKEVIRLRDNCNLDPTLLEYDLIQSFLKYRLIF